MKAKEESVATDMEKIERLEKTVDRNTLVDSDPDDAGRLGRVVCERIRHLATK